jgi:hypothetical protein
MQWEPRGPPALSLIAHCDSAATALRAIAGRRKEQSEREPALGCMGSSSDSGDPLARRVGGRVRAAEVTK